MALLTLAEAKEYLTEVSAGSSTQDARITALVLAADDLLARALGYPENDTNTRTLESATYTELLDGPSETDRRSLLLAVSPVTSITSIHDSPTWAYDAGDLVDASDYLSVRDGWVHLTPTGTHAWSKQLRVIQVIYVAGAALDDGEKEAVGQFVAHLFRLPKRQGRQSSSQKGHTASFRVEDIPAHVLRQLTHRANAAAIIG